MGEDDNIDEDEFQDDDEDDDDGFDFSGTDEVSSSSSNWSRFSSASSERKLLRDIEDEEIKADQAMKQLPPAPSRLDPVVSALPGVRKARATLAGSKDKAKREAAGLKAAREIEELLGDSGIEGAAAGLLDGDEPDDWGLDELDPRARLSKVKEY